MIGIIDYGTGNLHSVQKAFETCGAVTRLVKNASELTKCDKVILPGVGAFGQAMDALRRLDLIDAIALFITHQRPFLGICLGMQLLFDNSEESPKHQGMGMIAGTVKRIKRTMKQPHLGWNQVSHRKDAFLFQDIPDQSFFYFAHSFFAEPGEKNIISAQCEYGEPLNVAIENEMIFAVQFHPEKSQKWGMKIIENFINL